MYPQILNHKIPTLERGWTKTHSHFIQMGGFMLFEGDNPKGIMTPDMFKELLEEKKIEFPNITVEEIKYHSSTSRPHSRRVTNPFSGCP